MSAAASFERFNYLLRANKHVERKLILEALARLAATISLSSHRYIGFGSMWFGDFVLANRLLKIPEMWSLEHKPYVTRARFNRPYRNITVIPGHSNSVLTAARSDVWEKPLVAWLDYDGKLSPEVVSDINSVLLNASPDTFLAVTVNSVWRNYRHKPGGTIEAVRDLLGAAVIETRFDPGLTATGIQKDVLQVDMSEYLASCLLNYMTHRLAASGRAVSGGQLVFCPLASICHVDGAEMVTVAGALTARPNVAPWKSSFFPDLGFDRHGRPSHVRLDLPPISVKEKLAMDHCLPGSEASFIEETSRIGMGLSRAQRRKYRKHYRQFPVYAESML